MSYMSFVAGRGVVRGHQIRGRGNVRKGKCPVGEMSDTRQENGVLRRACLSVCVFVCPRAYVQNYRSNLHPIFVHVIMAVARSSLGGFTIRHVLPSNAKEPYIRRED